MLEVNGIDLHYGAAQMLRGVSLKAQPGKVTCVLGRNGVGKTSLLDALAGQIPSPAARSPGRGKILPGCGRRIAPGGDLLRTAGS